MAGNGKFINIAFPFKESSRGDFLELNNIDKYAIKSDLLHLLLTRKGERLYLPDFGTDLIKYIFELNDETTKNNMKKDISATVIKYLPNLQIDEITVKENELSEYGVTVKIDYTITEDVFKETDFVIIEL